MRLHLKTQYMLKGYAVNRNAVSGQKYEDLKKAATSTPPQHRRESRNAVWFIAAFVVLDYRLDCWRAVNAFPRPTSSPARRDCCP